VESAVHQEPFGSNEIRRPEPDVMDTVRHACQPLAPLEEAVIGRLGRTLAEMAPSLFALDQTPDVVADLVRCLLWAGVSPEPLAAVESYVQELGRSHGAAGFPPEGYQGVGQALLRVLRHFTPEGWDSWMSSAWVAHYLWLSAQLEAGAVEGRREAAARTGAHVRIGAEGPADECVDGEPFEGMLRTERARRRHAVAGPAAVTARTSMADLSSLLTQAGGIALS
jgi:hypothetical protein